MDNDTLKAGCAIFVLGALAAVGALFWYLGPVFVMLGMGTVLALGIGGLVYASKYSTSARRQAALKEGQVAESLMEMFTKGEDQQIQSLIRSPSTLKLPAGVKRDKLVDAARGLGRVRKAAQSTVNKYIPTEIKDDAVRQCIGSAQALFSLCERLTLAAQLGGDVGEVAERISAVNHEFQTIATATEGVMSQFSKLTLGVNDEALEQARRNIESVGWQAGEMNKLEQLLAQ